MKERLVFDPALPDETDNTGAYVRSADGTLITHTTYNATERLDVATGAEYDEGTAFAGGERGMFALAVNESGNFAPLRVNDDGELLVDVTVTSGADKAEDAAHTTGDIGSYVLSVRQDALAGSTDADGDYQSFKTDALGALWVNNYKTAPPTHTGWLTSQNDVGITAELIVAADLTNRKKILIQNASTSAKTLYLGSTNAVTAADGIRISAGVTIEMELAAGVAIYGIANAASADIRVAEFAYAS